MPHDPSRIRNVAIIAHVDHGKTTLVDALLRQTGSVRSGEAEVDRVLDSNDLERERGITILAKNASLFWEGYKLNIIDTPGHADFGGEVERTLMMADGALLLVDAAEGPLPQTRFVLSKALPLGIPIIVVINKVDRMDARPEEVHDEIFALFCDLEASDAQADFVTVYAVGRDGTASLTPDERGTSLLPLLNTIIERIPAPKGDATAPLSFLVHNTEHDEYVGRLAIGRIHSGFITPGQSVALVQADGTTLGKVGTVFVYDRMNRVKADRAEAGDIVALSGLEAVQIGDTISDPETRRALPRIFVEEPTIKVRFSVNDSPLAGRAGKWVTSRHLRERLSNESKKNIAMRVELTDEPDVFIVYGRGELMIAVLAETMRREGYEFSVGMPEVVVKVEDGQKLEPYERVICDIPDEYVGTVTSSLGERRGQLTKMGAVGAGRTRLELRVPSRGLIGFRSVFLTITRGTGLFSSLFDGWEPVGTSMLRRRTGSLVADRAGVATPYALFNLQPRGTLFIEPGTDVYEGMVVGESSRPQDIDVNVTREKKLTNIRAAGRDENVVLSPPRPLTIESALEFVDRDELVEVTPDAVRIRKRVLDQNRRPRRDEARAG